MEHLLVVLSAQFAGYLAPELAKLLDLIGKSAYRKTILSVLSGVGAIIGASVAYFNTGSVDGLADAISLIVSGTIGAVFAYLQYKMSKRNHAIKE